MGESAAETVREIEQVRGDLEGKVRVLGGAAALALWLGQQPEVSEIQLADEHIRFHHAGDQGSEVALLREMVLAGFAVAEFGSHSQSLEDVFMSVTRGAVQ